MSSPSGAVGSEDLRRLFHALSSDDQDERRPWASTPQTWWRDGALDPEVVGTVGTALTWCAMVDDDAGGIRAGMLGSLAALAEDGRLAEADLDRLVTGLDAQWIPDNEVPYSQALRDALGRPPQGRRDPKGYLWTIVDHVRALTAPDAEQRGAAVDKAAAEPGIGEHDRRALSDVARWATT